MDHAKVQSRREILAAKEAKRRREIFAAKEAKRRKERGRIAFENVAIVKVLPIPMLPIPNDGVSQLEIGIGTGNISTLATFYIFADEQRGFFTQRGAKGIPLQPSTFNLSTFQPSTFNLSTFNRYARGWLASSSSVGLTSKVKSMRHLDAILNSSAKESTIFSILWSRKFRVPSGWSTL